MRRATSLFGAIALVALWLTGPALGAGEVVITASPAEARVGQQVEVLLRTFVPFTATTLGLSSPRPEYPAPSGFLDVLYPWDDYPFDVRAEVADQSVGIDLRRDAHDSTLWRGIWTPTRVGTWTIRCYNFDLGTPGASTTVRVIDAAPLAATGDGLTPAVGLLCAAGGVLVGLLAARAFRSRHAPTDARHITS
jgi:hypothetical protein